MTVQMSAVGGNPNCGLLFVHVTRMTITWGSACWQTPKRSVLFLGSSSTTTNFPTCHAYFPAPDGYDILVGFQLGDGKPFSPLSLLHELLTASVSTLLQTDSTKC